MNVYPTGAILTQMARSGPLEPGPKRTFWAKSYGDSALEIGDEITITFTLSSRLYDGTGRDEGWRTDEQVTHEHWKVVDIKPGLYDWMKESITYFERVEEDED